MGRGRCCSPCCLLKVVLSASVISFVGVIVSEWMLASDATRDTFGPTTATMDFATPYPSGPDEIGLEEMEMDTTTTPSPTLMPQDPDEIYRISHLPRNDTDDRPKYFVLGDNEEIFFKLVELMIFVNCKYRMVSATTGDRVGAKYYNVSSVTNETAVVTFNSTRSKLTVSVNTKLTRRLTKVFDLQWETETKDVLTDYFMIGGGAPWYGGSTLQNLRFVMEENSKVTLQPFVSSEIGSGRGSFGSALERFWISNHGMALTVDPDVPLWVGYDTNDTGRFYLRAQYRKSPYKHFRKPQQKPMLKYRLWVAENLVKLRSAVVKYFLGKPSAVPNLNMIKSIVWSTGVRYRESLKDSDLESFAVEINREGLPCGKFQIDSKWEKNYGDLEPDLERLSSFAATVKLLKELGCEAVSLAVHPYVHLSSRVAVAKNFRYFVKGKNGLPIEFQWRGATTYRIDTTSFTAVEWLAKRLKNLQTKYGIDSFKFEGGETAYLGNEMVLNSTDPNSITTSYVELAAQFGGLVEVSSVYRNQKLPIYVRAAPKESNIDDSNGLKTLIADILELGFVGYPFINPGVIGGHTMPFRSDKTESISKDIYIRWLEMAIFLPVMEFSIPPWTLGDEIMKIFHSLWKLRLKLQPELVRLAHIAVKFGMPIIRPIWWLDQVDDALLEETEFLVGRDILVAPVWNPYDTFREVYLPEGEWISQQDRRTYEGPAKIMQDVPRDKIAFFLRSGANFSIPFEIPPTDSSERTIDEL